MKLFGIGCLHFGIADNCNKENITVYEYVNEIVKVLEQFSTVSEIKLAYDKSTKNEVIYIENVNPKLQDGEYCYPLIDLFHLDFNLYIPFRIQAQLIGQHEDHLNTFTEKFKVCFVQNWYGPFSLIECVNPSFDSEPSTAVQIIREYIFKEMKNIDTFLIADYIGPSPFHADFYLELFDKIENKDNNFIVNQIKEQGYDKFYFKCDSVDFKSESDALDSLIHELEDEIAFFYYIKVTQVKKMREWSVIHNDLHTILEFEDKAFKKTFKDKIFNRPAVFRKVFINIGLFKGQNIFRKSEIDTHYSNIYKHGKNTTYLKLFIDKELSESQTYPIEETVELLKYFDQKISKTFELMVLFIAAIIGGVIGSFTTILFS